MNFANKGNQAEAKNSTKPTFPAVGQGQFSGFGAQAAAKPGEKKNEKKATTTASTLGSDWGKKMATGANGKPQEAWYKSRGDWSVKMYIDNVEKRTEQLRTNYQEISREVVRNDKDIFDCLGVLISLSKQIDWLERERNKIKVNAWDLLHQQEDLIEKMKLKKDEKKKAKSNATASGAERQESTTTRMYRLAVDLGKGVHEMFTELNKQEDNRSSVADPLAEVAKGQLESLRWLDQHLRAVRDRINSINRDL